MRIAEQELSPRFFLLHPYGRGSGRRKPLGPGADPVDAGGLDRHVLDDADPARQHEGPRQADSALLEGEPDRSPVGGRDVPEDVPRHHANRKKLARRGLGGRDGDEPVRLAGLHIDDGRIGEEPPVPAAA